jgi:hypothetical protein
MSPTLGPHIRAMIGVDGIPARKNRIAAIGEVTIEVSVRLRVRTPDGPITAVPTVQTSPQASRRF